uniref:PHD-type domain-containing protein n=1 Tax=Pseudo-nitzschia australis TaxID=44445 RepID=A0A7S4ACF9_9STRA|mmetsp:Transcript_8324/g.17978  ORF Transcript_8324/g.17978 Transcript_8324/m.17978 type:complete len:486 (+) Transcript_8324:264-1721(+)|eukprot:CAMPEP_0168168804 /NCGR_PEP_ID=MMETSP0139_2-20121125/3300_1 /TAXON_ID=44445 /ORGANISM="Pseudo-nitzschia australis, Strain 10249 10 AB" /LENGTH=485 /DNA_ID=CAMNT_0008086181 /DNA_START=285 /DNA_END=1742 /DNA_ORIENTATION=-
MASKAGSFLRKSDRQKILRDLHQQGELTPGNAPESVRKEAAAVIVHNGNNHHHEVSVPIAEGESFGTGCLSCGRDDDHANLLLCEACNAEYHTYCLEPPLRAVPTGDWFCSECLALMPVDEDGLGKLVNALAPSFTSRFGEVCWAAGGHGFGWWPAFIYDPRLTIGSVRELARKNLGKKHLIYYLACNEFPFSALPEAKITKWEQGLIDGYHCAETAKKFGQKRINTFNEAFRDANLEMAKPIEMRMQWNHSDLPQALPAPHPKKAPPPRKRRRREVSPVKRLASDKEYKSSKSRPRIKIRGFPLITEAPETEQLPTRKNLNFALEGLRISMKNSASRANPIVEHSEDGDLFVKLLQKESLPIEGPTGEAIPNTGKSDSPCKNVGFIKLVSRKKSTFSDARLVIQKDLVPDILCPYMEWRFFVPGIGPVSGQQEMNMGPIYSFLRRTTLDLNLGDGTLLHPLKVFIMEAKIAKTSSVTDSSTSTS